MRNELKETATKPDREIRHLTACFALAALAAFGIAGGSLASVKEYVDAGRISWKGATSEVWTGDDSLLLGFTTVGSAHSLSIDTGLGVTARLLVVAGGGAGGVAKGTSTTLGNGAGGGAGGMIDTNVSLAGGTYAITVGAGGVAPDYASVAAAVGGNGGDSSVGTVAVAKGGGGGGGQCAGAAGGSGGGSSRASSTTIAGGSGTAGQGNAGGDATGGRQGAGGGGAGAAGTKCSSTAAGAGGAGLASDITGESVVYAGGGGGGSYNKSAGAAGGAGGGGAGAGTTAEAVAGTDGLGGGGGGSSTTYPAMNGGSGVVYVRITAVVDSKVSLPVIDDIEYDGKSHTVYTDLPGLIKVSGTVTATKVGSYSFKLKPDSEHEWKDIGGRTERTVTWKIVPTTIQIPKAVTDLVYNRTIQIGVPSGTGYAITDNAAENAGSYEAIATLSDKTNTRWSDGTADDQFIAWSIATKKVNLPRPREGLVYNGETQYAFDVLETDYDADGDISAKNAGYYSVTFTLNGNTSSVKNYEWNTTPASSKPYYCEWSIAIAPNAITRLTMDGWRVGGEPTLPVIEAYWGAETAVFRYGMGTAIDDVKEWVSDPHELTGAGFGWVRASIAPTFNYSGATNASSFTVWNNPKNLFRDSVEITIAGHASSEVFHDIPVLVRIDPEKMHGFTYERAGSDGHCLAFEDASENTLPYEVDTWDIKGVSLVWVKLPSLPKEGAKLTMYWNLAPSQYAPDYTPESVWTDGYVGVWHMGETIEPVQAAVTPSADSTGHKLHAQPYKGAGSQGNLSRMVSCEGVIGNGRINDTVSAIHGNYFEIPYYDNYDVGDTFTLSGFVRVDGMSANQTPQIASRRRSLSGSTDTGWGISLNGSSTTQVTVRGGKSTAVTGAYSSALPTAGFVHWAFVYQGTTAKIYANGSLLKSGSIAAAATNEFALLLGNGYANAEPGAICSLNGRFDELRLQKGVPTANRLLEEIAAATKEDYTSNSLVKRDGLLVNYWLTEPAMDKTMWDIEKDTPGRILTSGTPKVGTVTNLIYSVYDPSHTYRSIAELTEPGFYRIVFGAKTGDEYEPLVKEIDIRIVVSKPYTAIGGTDGDSGRVLLMNRSANPDCKIDRQGFSDTAASSSTYWEFVNQDGSADGPTLSFNLQTGTESILWKKNASARLWHLVDCRHGNTFPTSKSTALVASQAYLTWDSTYDYSFKARATRVSDDFTRVGNLVMRNLDTACVYSPCYEEGVGVFYFDAVNGWCRSNENPTNYTIVVEYATETTEGLPPYDENCYGTNPDDPAEFYTRLEGKWQRATMIPYRIAGAKIDSATITREEETDELHLGVTTGKTSSNFYRVVVPLDCRQPVRLRVRRTQIVPHTGSGIATAGIDDGGLILLDNLIASVPAMGGKIDPYGEIDPLKKGKQYVGQEFAMNIPYPSIHDDQVFARGSVSVYTNRADGAIAYSTNDFFSSATLHYRWRYLNQRVVDFDGWKYVDLDPANHFIAKEPLEIPPYAGDVEFWYEYLLQAPFYRYVDYSGSKLGVPYSEEGGVVSNRLNVAGQASAGSDWAFRLRDGRSMREKLTLVMSGKLAGEYPMYLIDDGKWQVLVKVPTNVNGSVGMTFRAENLQHEWNQEREYNSVTWGDASDGRIESLPMNGSLIEGGNEIMFTLDHIAGYLQIVVSEDYLTWSISRAEYQDFNHWHDVHYPEFSASFTETNGVDDIAMQIITSDMSNWTLFNAGNSAWDEDFYLADYTDPGFPRNVVYPNHITPAQWNGSNISFVWTELCSEDVVERKSSLGLAGKLQGLSRGHLEYLKSNCPQGIERVDFAAHLGQSMTFDAMSYAPAAYAKQNYTFWTPAMMSSNCNPDGSVLGDMAMLASCSVIAYHRPSRGCYEFRIERQAKGQRMYATIVKWYYENGVIRSKVLCGHALYNGNNGGRAYLWQQDNATTKYLGAMFISCRTAADNKSTEIVGGFINPYALSDAQDAKPITELGNGAYPRSYQGLWCTDAANPHLCGSYGVAAKDCPVKFVRMCHFDTPFDTAKITSHATGICSEGNGRYYNADGKEFVWDETLAKYDFQDVYKDGISDWEVPPGRLEAYQDSVRNYRIGLRSPQNISQMLYVQLQPKAGGDWKTYGEVEVGSSVGYSFRQFSVPIYQTGQWNLRFATGDYNADVVVDDIRQFQWQAPDRESITSRSDDYVYTQGVVGNTQVGELTARTLTLQPARAVLEKAVAMRSPVLAGAGHVAFSYTNANANAEVWLQVATNGVLYNLIGANGYNESVKSVELGQKEPLGAWITLAKYKYEDLGPFGTRTAYVGWHDSPSKPVTAIFRVFVPTNVVDNAIKTVGGVQHPTDYGQITITGMTVSDEPPISDRAWRGWNLRTIGDHLDSESRMYLIDTSLDDEVGYGLDCALNNSLRDVRGDVARAGSQFPAIFSPTMSDGKDVKSGVGAVSLKARLYTTTGAPETSRGGRIVLYGAANSVSGKWVKLDEFNVNSAVFSEFKWAAGAEIYKALKFEIEDAVLHEGLNPVVDRVVLDEVIISEKVQPTLGFVYAWPFRSRLMDPVEIETVGNTAEQPLVGESWGIQTKLVLRQMSDEIDLERGFDVRLSYYRGKDKWGYVNWMNDPKAVKNVPLTHVGGISNLVYRSVGTDPSTLVQPTDKAGEVVQFQITVHYYDRGGVRYERMLEGTADWRQPDWFYPIDYNRDNGGYEDPDRFSAYTILDTVSPGRAWINEVNFNNGPADETGTKSVVLTNQFVEICVPSGISMAGWYLRLKDGYKNSRTKLPNEWIMALFGRAGQLPEKKVSEHMVNGYEFVVVESPLANGAGGVKDPDGKPAADGVWTKDGISGTAPRGEINYSYPFEFELVRPSGIIEHQVIIQGTNEWCDFSFGSAYYGTNLLARLNEEDPSPIRFYAGEEVARRAARPVDFGDIGVVGGMADGNPAPGREGTWREGMGFTAGRINENQVIPKDWITSPNGTNSWVYLTVLGDHLHQNLGGETNPVTMVILTMGTRTNVVYRADPWYETASIDVNGQVQPAHWRGEHSFAFTPDAQIYRLTATEGPDHVLAEEYGLDDENRYTPAVLKWLAEKYPEKDADSIRLAYQQGFKKDSVPVDLSLTSMYWLDIPPFTDSGKREWWLRGDVTDFTKTKILKRTYSGVEHVYTNLLVQVQLYISNSVTKKAYAPYRLQGLANEQSDTFGGNWTSETFKISGKLMVNEGSGYNLGFLPFRTFTFNPNSFSSSSANPRFTSVIELMDPFSPASPGWGYGWGNYPNSTARTFKWFLDEQQNMLSVERLKADDTYESE